VFVLKQKKVIIFSTIVLLVLLALHFIPVYNQSGVIDRGLANVCIGYTNPVPLYHRLITGGNKGFNDDKKDFKVAKLANNGGGIIASGDYGCAEPVTLRLYLL
jgi:hypothetical protein